MSEQNDTNKKYDDKGREIVDEQPHGKYVKYESGATFWEPANPNCFYGEDCPTCSGEN